MPIFGLEEAPLFPQPHLAEPSGLLALGGDLRVERLIQAYAHGIFPWYTEGSPILWWSPDPRMVLYPDRLKVSKSLRSIIRKGKYEVRFDHAFQEVIRACAGVPRKGQPGTWITQEMIRAYIDLHEAGYAHSVEVYSDRELVGGLYGVSLGRAFFGESMFHHVRDTSKIALFHLVERLRSWDFQLIDSQVETTHMLRLGAINIRRKAFLEELAEALTHPTIKGKW